MTTSIRKRFAYDDQLASIPSVVSAQINRKTGVKLDPSRPIVFSGIGTSLHAARVAAGWVTELSQGVNLAHAIDAHDLGSGLVPLTGMEQVVVISHRGYKRYPNESLRLAREAGCATVSIVGADAPGQSADFTIRTCKNETAGTFSVSYSASLAALLNLVFATFPNGSGAYQAETGSLPSLLTEALEAETPADTVMRLAQNTPILIVGFGQDFVTAQEAALKIKEGAWLWTEAMSTEFALHGTPASFTANMSAIVVLPEHDDGGRSANLLDVFKQIGVAALACGSDRKGAIFGFRRPETDFCVRSFRSFPSIDSPQNSRATWAQTLTHCTATVNRGPV